MGPKLLATAFALIAVGAGSEAHAGVKDLLGAWQIKSVRTKTGRENLSPEVEIVVAFRARGKLVLKIRFRNKRRTRVGTYTVKGRTLSMTLDNSTEKVTYRRRGKTLTLFNASKRETTVLKRR